VAGVPLIDLRAQFDTIRDETVTAVRRVLESQRFILGEEVEALERDIARLVGARHAVGCASGSDAIMLAIASVIPERGATPLAGSPGSLPAAHRSDAPEVVTVPFTFFASAGSVVHAGARPRFVDIQPDIYGMDPVQMASAIGPRTVAVLPVHLFGQPCDIDEIIAAAGHVPVVEDAAQAIGAMYAGLARPSGAGPRSAGTMGRAGCLSFFPTKNLGGAGDGGMVLTSDDSLAERLFKLRVHGGLRMYQHESVGWNSRLDEIQAAILRVKLPRLASWSQARAARAAAYDALFQESGLVARGLVTTPVSKPDRTHIFHQYVIRVPREAKAGGRDALRAHLSSLGIASGVYYPVPLHLQPCFRSLGHARGDFPVSERAAEEVLALPIYPELGSDQQALVVRGIAEHFGLP